MDVAPVHRKPHRLVWFYLPLSVGMLAAAFVEPMCVVCPWHVVLFGKVLGLVGGFSVGWIVVMVTYYGYHLTKTLLHRPR